MDIFSFLPIIIFIYAIATIFSPKNKTPGNRRQSPFPPPDTWKEKIEQMERQWFPQETPRSQRNPQPLKSTRTDGQLASSRTRPVETRANYEGFGTEGYSGTEGFGSEGVSGGEGSTGSEGTWGTEGTSGSEGTFGTEGSFGIEGPRISQGIPKRREVPPTAVSKEGRAAKSGQSEKASGFSNVSEDSLMQGVIWAEVLGKPRARSGWSHTRRH